MDVSSDSTKTHSRSAIVVVQTNSHSVAIAKHIRKGVEKLDPIRFRWLLWYSVAWIVALVGAGATLLAFAVAQDIPAVSYTVAGVSLLCLLIFGAISSSRAAALHRAFDEWREAGVKLLDETASFAAGRGLARTDFDASGLNGAYYNTYASSNLLAVGGIRSSALSAKHVYTETYYVTEYYTDAQGHSQSRQVKRQRTVVVPVFDGIMLMVPAELPHPVWLVLRARDAGTPKGVHRLTVASPFLTKNYAVGATDQFAGHRALTPTLMEALWDYRQQFKYTPGYSYRDGMLYLTIPAYWLEFGHRPGKWAPVTTARLDRVLKACQSSIGFLKETAEKLAPT